MNLSTEFTDVYWPIRCYSCGYVVAKHQTQFEELITLPLMPKSIFETLGLNIEQFKAYIGGLSEGFDPIIAFANSMSGTNIKKEIISTGKLISDDFNNISNKYSAYSKYAKIYEKIEQYLSEFRYIQQFISSLGQFEQQLEGFEKTFENFSDIIRTFRTLKSKQFAYMRPEEIKKLRELNSDKILNELYTKGLQEKLSPILAFTKAIFEKSKLLDQFNDIMNIFLSIGQEKLFEIYIELLLEKTDDISALKFFQKMHPDMNLNMDLREKMAKIVDSNIIENIYQDSIIIESVFRKYNLIFESYLEILASSVTQPAISTHDYESALAAVIFEKLDLNEQLQSYLDIIRNGLDREVSFMNAIFMEHGLGGQFEIYLNARNQQLPVNLAIIKSILSKYELNDYQSEYIFKYINEGYNIKIAYILSLFAQSNMDVVSYILQFSALEEFATPIRDQLGLTLEFIKTYYQLRFADLPPYEAFLGAGVPKRNSFLQPLERKQDLPIGRPVPLTFEDFIDIENYGITPGIAYDLVGLNPQRKWCCRQSAMTPLYIAKGTSKKSSEIGLLAKDKKEVGMVSFSTSGTFADTEVNRAERQMQGLSVRDSQVSNIGDPLGSIMSSSHQMSHLQVDNAFTEEDAFFIPGIDGEEDVQIDSLHTDILNSGSGSTTIAPLISKPQPPSNSQRQVRRASRPSRKAGAPTLPQSSQPVLSFKKVSMVPTAPTGQLRSLTPLSSGQPARLKPISKKITESNPFAL